MMQVAERVTSDSTGRPNGATKWSVPAWFVSVVTGIAMLSLVWLFSETLDNSHELAKGDRFTLVDGLAQSRRLTAVELQQLQLVKQVSNLPPEDLKRKIESNSKKIEETNKAFNEILISLRVLEDKFDSLKLFSQVSPE